MQLDQSSITRRAFQKISESAWLLFALFPWRASAQGCSGCPTTYIPCIGGTGTVCGGVGYFVTGCASSPSYVAGSICNDCANGSYCYNYLYNTTAYCNGGLPLPYHWTCCGSGSVNCKIL